MTEVRSAQGWGTDAGGELCVGGTEWVERVFRSPRKPYASFCVENLRCFDPSVDGRPSALCGLSMLELRWEIGRQVSQADASRGPRSWQHHDLLQVKKGLLTTYLVADGAKLARVLSAEILGLEEPIGIEGGR
ncbi:hypothetical protein CDEST_14571 [Colletotrichum destructivum]|uniref:Uncharacterized protein n=1 Tax=Colletotrichum destructivum TaxID=34406 RepID=A0AAX4J1X0_9PEZI|nr:hypothetical protein CDEST_14571 [Colletotrichum destructivum]